MPKDHANQPQKKQFDAWNKVKKNINRRAKVPIIREGEIWWFADGQNIGVEIDGKGKGFARPVLVLVKFGQLSFLGLPLTTQKHRAFLDLYTKNFPLSSDRGVAGIPDNTPIISHLLRKIKTLFKHFNHRKD